MQTGDSRDAENVTADLAILRDQLTELGKAVTDTGFDSESAMEQVAFKIKGRG